MRTVHAVGSPDMTIDAIRVYGILINGVVLVNVRHSILLHFTHGSPRQCVVETLPLGSTEIRLLVHLLLHADDTVADYREALTRVWENNDLVPSYKRMSEVVRDLRGKLSLLGLPADFIRTVRGQGYCIEGHVITPLYCGEENPLFQTGN
ncbi:helix-turn-helix domain-containing protein [Yersinia intermedia]|uniref:winged helix-turn-helix domain-containing protein n=1 Tax=Yersinia intermedia TaxID=631 RepID=UPI0022FDD308|nr:helix-turn-helix domain-containing protein [Yersinia intermedia]MDA5483486.1 helix-turn-helix domain-containing protein [Yersinia intermedia]